MRAEYTVITYDRLRDIKIETANISRVNYHEHKDFEVLAVTHGEIAVTTRSGEFNVREGEFTVFNSRAAHGLAAVDESASVITVQYSPYFCREYYPHARRMQFIEANASEIIDKQRSSEIFDHICATAQRYCDDDRLFELRCITHVLELILMLAENLPCEFLNPEQFRNIVTRDNRIDAIIEHLETKYQQRLLLSDLADIVGLKPAYLSHFFVEHVGISIREYIANLRFNHALRHIDRDLSLSDIAHGSGFSDLKYMTHEFVKRTGKTPSQIRKHIQRKV